MLENVTTKDLKEELERRMSKSSKTPKRYEIIGIWSGYNSGQRRIVHREYTTNKNFVKGVSKLGNIYFSDGTALEIEVRQLKYRERKEKEINGYNELIRKCMIQDTNNVSELK